MNLTNLNTTVTIIGIIVTVSAVIGVTYLVKIKKTHKQSIKNSTIFGDAVSGDKHEYKAKSKN